ncbi:MAG: hypothetical protein EG824_11945 [Deltaproteobacteria bacterium]|nr:hypothetical protein [Deltaproteobacteria bacterium]
MILRTIMLLFFVLALSAAATARAESNSDGTSRQAEHARLSDELKQLQDGLPAKNTELARIHRKWVVVKGRMPSKKELEKYEKKRAKGEVDIEDNPYVNKNPLSSPGRYRTAYYKKLEEIKGDESRIAKLREEIKALNP